MIEARINLIKYWFEISHFVDVECDFSDVSAGGGRRTRVGDRPIACSSAAYAIEQPADVDIIEIVIRPTAQDFWSHPSSSRERRQVFAGLTALLNPA